MRTILIVEDTELNIDPLTQLLEEDYCLLVARDGGESVVMANECHPDQILMDISLHGAGRFGMRRPEQRSTSAAFVHGYHTSFGSPPPAPC